MKTDSGRPPHGSQRAELPHAGWPPGSLQLREFLELPGGVPSADTFRRVFEAMNVRTFNRCLAELTSELTGDLKDQVVAIDGRTLRRSFDRRSKKSPLHMVSAWVAERGITLGQIAPEEKSNEITAIPALLETIDVRGATVTVDAIVDGGADYALALKDNHRLHWTLDMVFHEDMSRIRSRTGASNLAQVRKLALSLLKLEQSRPGKSVAMKRKRAGWEPDYAFRVLSTISSV